MRFHVLNVGHGLCAYAAADNGNLIVFDCGHMSYPEFRPSEFLHARRYRSIQRLFITNYDEDHISDLPNLRSRLQVQILHRNKSISPEKLRELKRQGGPITPAMAALLDMMSTYNSPVTDPPDFPEISWHSFWAEFGTDFEDTNNISVVTFLRCRRLNIVISGDLEAEGWRHHLRNENFRQQLRQVNVFIASHHGRESGYCREVFDYCTPDVIVFSDSEIIHATQEMASAYAAHTRGVTFNAERRYVLSTRSDGDFWWDL